MLLLLLAEDTQIQTLTQTPAQTLGEKSRSKRDAHSCGVGVLGTYLLNPPLHLPPTPGVQYTALAGDQPGGVIRKERRKKESSTRLGRIQGSLEDYRRKSRSDTNRIPLPSPKQAGVCSVGRHAQGKKHRTGSVLITRSRLLVLLDHSLPCLLAGLAVWRST